MNHALRAFHGIQKQPTARRLIVAASGEESMEGCFCMDDTAAIKDKEAVMA